MPRLLPFVLLLIIISSCGPLKPAPSAVIATAAITNNYAVSIFSLTLTPATGTPFHAFSSERIEADATSESATFNLPLAGSDVAIDMFGESLGQTNHFAGTRHMGTGAEKLILVYDFDLATADFTVKIGTQAN